MTADKPVWKDLEGYEEFDAAEMTRRSADYLAQMKMRRTVREYDDRPVPEDVLRNCLETAITAPSGANLQPWHFTVITDPAVKHRIRVEAEVEEQEFYSGKAPQEWLDALSPLGTDEHKAFLEKATLIAIFAQRHGELPDGRRVKHYYVPESVGIATGFLISALHNAGLVTLTHTPSLMNFLNEICERPDSEKPYLLLVCGYPETDCKVPEFGGTRIGIDEKVTWFK